MSKDTVTIYKLFWADQDAEQEVWLREKAREGLHLVKVNEICGWTFSRGAPDDMVYRVDYNNQRNAAAYRQLFEDAGWELAAGVAGWQYWRKQAGDGPAPEIFTDLSSSLSKYKQILEMLAMCALILLICLMPVHTGFLGSLGTPGRVGMVIVVLAAMSLNTYCAWRLAKRIRSLQAERL